MKRCFSNFRYNWKRFLQQEIPSENPERRAAAESGIPYCRRLHADGEGVTWCDHDNQSPAVVQ